MWTEVPKGKNKKPVNKDRFISKMFLRCVNRFTERVSLCSRCFHSGDSVVLGKPFNTLTMRY